MANPTKGKPQLKKGRHHDSLNARAVARDVIDHLQRGEKVRMAPIIRAHGYSPKVAADPKNVTNTQAYKDEMFTYTQKLEQHRKEVLEAMMRKDLDEEQYRTLADSQAKLTHDVQLLTGGKTENVGVEEDRLRLKAVVQAIQLEE